MSISATAAIFTQGIGLLNLNSKKEARERNRNSRVILSLAVVNPGWVLLKGALVKEAMRGHTGRRQKSSAAPSRG